MDSNYYKVHDSLITKKLLLKEAEYLERYAVGKRKEAYSDKEVFFEDISVLQRELLDLAGEYQRLEASLTAAISGYETMYHTIFPSVVDIDFYNSYTYQDCRLSSICETLFALSKRICDIVDLLKSVCDTLGHDFKFVKTDDIFDYDSLEMSFDKHDIYYCSCCGKLQLLEPEVLHIKNMSLEEVERLRRIRFLMNFEPFKLPFMVISGPQEKQDLKH